MASSQIHNDHYFKAEMKRPATNNSRTEHRTGGARAWQRMLSGRRLDLLNPSPLDIEIEDIAHGLARVARWNGQTLGRHALSVAQHSIIVENIAATLNPGWHARYQLAALLHDAAEYVVGDLISPFKAALGIDYKAFEINLMRAIHIRFGLPGMLDQDIEKRIKHADQIAAFYEATGLAGFTVAEARQYFGSPEALPTSLAVELTDLKPTETETAQRQFLARFHELLARMGDDSTT
jgi:5'-deoxynucleotidase YfbR-like HD superfamily hydrolase